MNIYPMNMPSEFENRSWRFTVFHTLR